MTTDSGGQKAGTAGSASEARGAALAAGVIATVFLFRFTQLLFLSDDAFISFVYSRNLVDGLGLVWNFTERVEGYTNFLWVMLLAVGMWLGIEPELFAPLMGMLSGFGVLWWVSRLGPGGLWRWGTPALLVANSSFVAWSSGGLETQMFSCWCLAAVVATVQGRPIASGFCLAAATLTRPEGVLWAGICGLLLLSDVLRRAMPPRHWLLWASACALPVAAHGIWRYSYYGFWLPNTFYAKVGGTEWADGFHYIRYFFSEYRLELLLPLVLLSLVGVSRRRLHRPMARAVVLCAMVTVVYGLYVSVEGGDFLEFRFMVPWLPFVFFLATVGARNWLLWTRTLSPRVALTGPLALAALIGLWIFAAWGDPQGEPPEGFESVESIGHFAQFRTEQGLHLRQMVDEGILPEDFSLVTGGAGALPYYSRLYVLDRRGLNDVEVAHGPYVIEDGYAGHRRWASPGLIRRRGMSAVILGHLIVLDRHAKPPESMIEYGLKKVEQYSRGAELPEDRLRLVCRIVDEDRYLLFGSNLAPDALEPMVGHLPSCLPSS